MLYISGVNYESFTDGEGCRCTIFISGCKHMCPGCQNPGTWSFTAGELVTDELIDQINNEIKKRPFLSGLTISGGDPLYSYEEVFRLLDKLCIPYGNVWLYTGFTWEELIKFIPAKDLAIIDVIVDGPYAKALRDVSLRFRGSKNQRIIDVAQSIAKNEIVLYEPRKE